MIHYSIVAITTATVKTPNPVTDMRTPLLTLAVTIGLLLEVGNGLGGMLVAPPVVLLELDAEVELEPVKYVTKFVHAIRVPLFACTTTLRLPIN